MQAVAFALSGWLLLGGEPLSLPVARWPQVEWFHVYLAQPPIKALLPIPILLGLAFGLWWMFRGTWRAFDWETTQARIRQATQVKRDSLGWLGSWRSSAVRVPTGAWRAGQLGRRKREDTGHSLFAGWGASQAQMDYRPAVCFVVTAVVLTLQEYYGGRGFYDSTLEPIVRSLEKGGWTWLKLKKYGELYGYGWWVSARVLGYVVVPIVCWRILFPKDSVLDMGLRGRGFMRHLWIYGLCLAVVVPAMVVVSQQPDFGTYYPFYKNSSRSWYDFLLWESMYWVQFFALEFFFRGWMVGVLRPSLGAGAIFAMAVPYCMIHYGKPYLEAQGAIVAGVVLGSLSMRTRSIYAGFLLHVIVALAMDLLSLWKRGALPQVWWPPG